MLDNVNARTLNIVFGIQLSLQAVHGYSLRMGEVVKCCITYDLTEDNYIKIILGVLRNFSYPYPADFSNSSTKTYNVTGVQINSINIERL